MLRDLTMIFSVLVSVLSLGFGVYKNIEAGNAKGFAYEQAYRVMGAVQQSTISAGAKADILDAALGSLATPPPVIDLSRSSADTTAQQQVCTQVQKDACVTQAGELAGLNATCTRNKNTGDACSQADQLKSDIASQQCLKCFTQ